MKSKLLYAIILIISLLALVHIAYADGPIQTDVILDTQAPTSTGVAFGGLANNGQVTMTASGLSDGAEGTGIKTIDWIVDLIEDDTETTVFTKTTDYATPPTGAIQETTTITTRGFYKLTVVITDWVNNSNTYTRTQYLSRTGDGYVTMQGWTQGEDPNSPVYGSTTNSTSGVIIEYKKSTEPDSSYTDTVPTFDADEYIVRVTFPATGIYDPVIATATFEIYEYTEAPYVHILKDTHAPICKSIDFGLLVGNEMRITVKGMYDGPYGSGVKMTKWTVRDAENNIIYTSADSEHTYDTEVTTDYIDVTFENAGIHSIELEIIDYYGNSTSNTLKHDCEEHPNPTIGNYVAQVDIYRAINATLLQRRYEYNGQYIEALLRVQDGNTELTLNDDYELAFNNNKDVGTASVTITGKGIYSDPRNEITLYFEIYQKELVVAADNKEKTYGVPNPELTYTVSGAVGGEVAGFTGELATTCTTTSVTGEYPITIGTLAMVNNGLFKTSNYYMSFIPGTLTVATDVVTVSASNYIGVYDGLPHTITIDVTDPASGYTIRYGTTPGGYDLITIPTRTEAGTTHVYFEITASGYNTYNGSADIIISPKSMLDPDITASLNQTTYTYSGLANRPTALVKDGTTTLIQDTDYTIRYMYNINAGTAIAVITGIGNYTGVLELEFTINKANLTVTPDELSKIFGEVDPRLTFTYAGALNGEVPDFNGYLEREPGEEVGQYEINRGSLILQTTGSFIASNYEIVFTTGKMFSITALSLNSPSISASLDNNTFVYDGTSHTPNPTIYDGYTTLLQDVDYTLSYTGNKNVGDGTVVATGIGNYTGTITLPIHITPRQLVVTPNLGQYKYAGDADPTLTYRITNTITNETPRFAGLLGRAAGEEVGSYEMNQGTLALSANGTFLPSNYTFAVTPGVYFDILACDFTSVVVNPTTYIYDGTEHEPEVFVYTGTSSDILLEEGVHYTVAFENNKNAGTATAVITGINHYAGKSISKTFTIQKRQLYITADNKTKVYQDPNPPLTYSVANLVTGEAPGFTGSLTTPCNINSAQGQYPINRGTLQTINSASFLNSNYNIVFTPGILTVTDKAMIVNATGYNGPYDGQAHGIQVVVSEPVGLYTIRYDTNQNGSYTATTSPTRTNVGNTVVYFRITCDGYSTYYGNASVNIYGAEFSNGNITLGQNQYIYNGQERRPSVSFVVNSVMLTQGVDYTVTYRNNINVGTATVIVTGIGNYATAGTKEAYFIIKKAPLTIKPTGSYEKIYQDSDPVFNWTITGLQNGEVQATTGNLTRAPGENVGVYEVNSIGTLTLQVNGLFNPANYELEFLRNDVYLRIKPRDISSGLVTFNEEYVYTGEEIRPVPTLEVNGTILNVNTDYTITYTNNLNNGTATITMTGIGNYTGTRTATFNISKVNIERYREDVTIRLDPSVFVYDGTPKEPATIVTYRGRELVRNRDYTVSYVNNIEVGNNSAIARITGIGNFEGTLQETFSIIPKELQGDIELSQYRYEYDGTPKEPRVVRFTTPDGWELVQGIDFVTTYVDNVNVGNAKVIITGSNHFSGTMEVGFEIYKTTPIITLQDKIVPYNGGTYSIDRATITKIFNYAGDSTSYSAEQMLVYNYYSDDTLTNRLTSLPSETGTYYVQAYLIGDANHNEAYSNVATLTIFGNPTAPLIRGNDGTRIIPSGGFVRDEIFIDIYGSEVPNARSILVGYLYSLDGTTWGNYTEILHYTEEGTITVYAQAYVVGYETMVSDVTSYTVTIDRTAPVETNVIISDEQDSVTMEVRIDGNEIKDIYITEDANYTPTDEDIWADMTGTKGEQNTTVFELSQGDGIKTLYIWERDNAGNVVGPIEKQTWLNAIRIGNKNVNNTNIYFKVTDLYLHTPATSWDITKNDVVLHVNGFDTDGKVISLSKNAITSSPNDGYRYIGVIENVTGNGQLSYFIDKDLIFDRAGNHISDANQEVETKEITVDNISPILKVTRDDQEVKIYVEDEHIQAVMLNGAILGRLNGNYTATLNNGMNRITVTDSYGNDESIEIENIVDFMDYTSVPNAPELLPGMKALYYDGSTERLEGYFTSSMYDYGTIGDNSNNTTSRWANARTEDGSEWVWIPRYAYKVVYYTDASMTTESSTPTAYMDYDVIFLRNRTNEYIDQNGIIRPLPDGYTVVEAFTRSGGAPTELLGFWMSKYEISREDSFDDGATWEENTSLLGGGSTLTSNAGNNADKIRAVSKANKTPWRGISVSNAFQNALYMLPMDGSHLMKNSEYEATLILGLSEYGRNGDHIALDTTRRTGTDVETSTTGNITGVFDMIGGSWEYTSTYINNGILSTYAANLVNSTESSIKEVITTSDLESFIYSKLEKQVIDGTNNENPFRTSFVIFRGLDYTSQDMAVESVPVGGSPDDRVGYRVVLFNATGTTIGDNTNGEGNTTSGGVRVILNANGGTGPTGSILNMYTLSSGIFTLPSSDTFVREGYNLVGWSRNSNTSPSDTGNYYAVDSTTQFIEDTVLYAVWKESGASLLDGATINRKLKALAGNNSATVDSMDDVIKKIEWTTTEPSAANKQTKNIISSNTSKNPVYAWLEGDTIKLYSEASNVYMNANSASMFKNLAAVTSITTDRLDSSKVTNMASMFENCSLLASINLSRFDTKNVTNMSKMFAQAESLTSIDATSFNTGKVTAMDEMFAGCSGASTIKVSSFDTSKVTTMREMFNGCSNVTTIDVRHFDTSRVTDMGSMFAYCENMTNLDVTSFNTGNVRNMSEMFESCSSLTSLNVSGFDTGNVTDMSRMFTYCTSLDKINVGNFNTSKVEDMEFMFGSCTSATIINVENFDTTNVVSMGGMFYDCKNVAELNVSSFNTNKVEDMASMFKGCEKVTALDLSSFRTGSLVEMSEMFRECLAITYLDLSGFDTKNVIGMNGVFRDCSSLTAIDISNFNTAQVTNMAYMFKGCMSLLELDLTSFNTSRVTNMTEMFNSNSSLQKISASDSFTTGSVTASTNMFNGCFALDGGAGTTYRESNPKDKTYARIDGGTSNPGYFRATLDDPSQPDQVYSVIYSTDDPTVTNIPARQEAPITQNIIISLQEPIKSDEVFSGWTKTKGSQNVDYTPGEVYFDRITVVLYPVFGVDVPTATFLPGREFNTKIKTLAGDASPAYNTDNTSIKGVVWSSTAPSSANMQAANIVSTQDSDDPIYAWFEDEQIKLYTAARRVYTNEDASYMYGRLEEATQIDLNRIDTRRTTNMSLMFTRDYILPSLDLIGFNTSSVTNMNGMFNCCISIQSLDLSNFDTHNVTDMRAMFSMYSTAVTLPSQLASLNISSFDTSNVTNMRSMFQACVNLTELDVSHFDTRNVTDMAFMFSMYIDGNSEQDSKLTSLDVSNFDTRNVTNMAAMFQNQTKLTQLDISSFDTSKVTDMHFMFNKCKQLTSLNVSSFDTKNVTDMYGMFNACHKLATLDTSNFNTSKVTNMQNMFSLCWELPVLDLSNFDTSKVTNMEDMFENCFKLARIYASDEFVTDLVTSSNTMFNGCLVLDGGNGTTYNASNPKDKTYAHIDGGTANPGYFYYSRSTFLPGQEFNVKIKTLAGDIDPTYDSDNTSIKGVVWSSTPPTSANKQEANIVSTADSDRPIYAWYEDEQIKLFTTACKTYTNESARTMYAGLLSATQIDLTGIDTSRTSSMKRMFDNCASITELDLSGFDTSSVTEMIAMFQRCGKLEELDLSNFDTSNVESMEGMFNLCQSLYSLDISSFDTSNVKAMNIMFQSCLKLTSLDLRHFDTSNVTDMSYMFNMNPKASTNHLTYLNVSSFDTSNVTNMELMFNKCDNLTSLDLTNFDTRDVTDMRQMFEWCTNLEVLDLSSFDTSNVTDMSSMFRESTNLKIIYASDDFDTSNVIDSENMFIYCNSLNGGNGTTYNNSNPRDKTYAHIDGGADDPGYFYYTRTTFLPGKEFNAKIKALAGDINPTYNSDNTSIKGVVWSDTAPTSENMREANIVSTTDSDKPIYAWYEDEQIKLYTTACKTYANENASNMFNGLLSATQIELVGIDTSGTTSMESMFQKCENLTSLDVGIIDTSQATDLSFMFSDCRKLREIDVTNFDTSNVSSMSSMFQNCYELETLDVSAFNTIQVADMSFMFSNCLVLPSIDVTNFDTHNVTSMKCMFQSCDKIETLDLLGFNTNNVTDMSYMFSNCSKLSRIYATDTFVTSQVTSSDYMFDGCMVLDGGAGTTYNNSNPKDKTYAHIDGGTENPGYFYCEKATFLPGTEFNTKIKLMAGNNGADEETEDTLIKGVVWSFTAPSESNMQEDNIVSTLDSEKPIYAWYEDEQIKLYTKAGKVYTNESAYKMYNKLTAVTQIDLNRIDTSKTTDMTGLFASCYSVETLDVSRFDTSNVTSMQALFYNCKSLSSIDVSSFDTSNVTNMRQMFYCCYELVELDLSNFDTSNVTTMRSMFSMFGDDETAASRLTTIDLSSFDTSNVTSMRCMFQSCESLTQLDLSNFNTSNVTDMAFMFSMYTSDGLYRSQLTSLDVSSFDTSNVTDMKCMFQCDCKLTELDLSSFDTSNVTDMMNMFRVCERLEQLDVSSFDTSNVTDMTDMFNTCRKLDGLDLNGFDTSNVTSMSGMFNECREIVELDLTAFKTSNVTNMTEMFDDCRKVQKILASEEFVTDSVTESENMFRNCLVLFGGTRTAYNESNPKDKTYARLDNGLIRPGYFWNIRENDLTLIMTDSNFPTLQGIKAEPGDTLVMPFSVELQEGKEFPDEGEIVVIQLVPTNRDDEPLLDVLTIQGNVEYEYDEETGVYTFIWYITSPDDTFTLTAQINEMVPAGAKVSIDVEGADRDEESLQPIEIEATVTIQKASAKNIVLVLDTSGSMGFCTLENHSENYTYRSRYYCKICSRENITGNARTGYRCSVHGTTDVVNTGSRIYICKKCGEANSRMTALREAANAFTKSVIENRLGNENISISLIEFNGHKNSFGNDTGVQAQLIGNKTYKGDELIIPSGGSYNNLAIKGAIDRLDYTYGGGTNMKAGIQRAYTTLTTSSSVYNIDNAVNVVLFLSDGDPSYDDWNLSNDSGGVLTNIRSVPNLERFSIGLGEDITEAGERELKAFVDDDLARFKTATDAEMLVDQFEQIAASINSMQSSSGYAGNILTDIVNIYDVYLSYIKHGETEPTVIICHNIEDLNDCGITINEETKELIWDLNYKEEYFGAKDFIVQLGSEAATPRP